MDDLIDFSNEEIESTEHEIDDNEIGILDLQHDVAEMDQTPHLDHELSTEFRVEDTQYNDLAFNLGSTDDVDIFGTLERTNEIWSDFDASPNGHDTFWLDSVFVNSSFDLDPDSYHEITEVYGTPAEDMLLFDEQDSQYSCAVATTNMMFRSQGFYDFNESMFGDLFLDQGIYDPASGTTFRLIDDILNNSGVEELGLHANEISGFDIDSLKAELETGNSLLIALDAGQLNLFTPPGTGHAVLLTGIVESAGGDVAIINDPGYAGGAGREVPLEQFQNATAYFGNSGISLSRA